MTYFDPPGPTDRPDPVPASHDDEHDHDADVTGEVEHARAPWIESGEHPAHPEVAGQPDPA